MIKYLELGVYGYKGGELSTPYCKDKLEDLIVHQDDILYKIFDDLDEEDELDWVEFKEQAKLVPMEEFSQKLEKYISTLVDNIYADTEESVTEFYKLDTDTNKMKELSAGEIFKIIDISYIHSGLFKE